MSHIHMGLKRETQENDVGMWKTLFGAFTSKDERRKSMDAIHSKQHPHAVAVDHSLDIPEVVAVVSNVDGANNKMVVASANPVFAEPGSPPAKRNSLQAQKEQDEEEKERRSSSHRLSFVNDEVRRKSNPIYNDLAQHVERKESIV